MQLALQVLLVLPPHPAGHVETLGFEASEQPAGHVAPAVEAITIPVGLIII